MGRSGKIAVGALVLLGAIGLAATRLIGVDPAGEVRDRAAPELTGIAGWINTEPFALADLRGDVVLVDFWTFSCINCVRTFPHLRALHERYRPAGLRVIGVHSPEFDFERVEGNVRSAVERHRIGYPVVLDSDMATWRAFRNRYWPRVYLIDAAGTIRWDHIGEGGDREIEHHVRALLAEASAELPAPLPATASGPSAGITPEVYLGEARAAPDTHQLEGEWEVRGEFAEAGSQGGRIVLAFRARDVFVVAALAGDEARLEVLLDGEPAGDAMAGGAGTTIRVARDDLYPLIHLPRVEEHTLTLVVPPRVRVYTFTFG